MLFNSLDFALFLPLAFLLYWFVFAPMGLKVQNGFVLVASYIFYGWWDWRFLFLIALSSLVDFVVGLKLSRTTHTHARKRLLSISLITNLGLLFIFKYYGFFADSLASAFYSIGVQLSLPTLKIILPVGISFYTFQTLSYTIDVYREQLKPTDDAISFFAYVSFFPQLVAGPIERASFLLPQFFKERRFDQRKATEGCRQMLWGLFKKVVVADTCGAYSDAIFDRYGELSSPLLIFGSVMFAVQIYGDFSGYSDVAIGLSKLFGFELKDNFKYPYFSRDIAEFWRRWHISLSTWFRDYLYIPLGGSRGGTASSIRNVFAIFLVSGFWHGANWTFIIWGLLNALYFLPLMLGGKNRRFLGEIAEGRTLPGVAEALAIAQTFALTCLAWIFFRADTISIAVDYLQGVFSLDHLSQTRELLNSLGIGKRALAMVGLKCAVLFGLEWYNRASSFGLAIGGWPTPARWATYYAFIFWILKDFGNERAFIYFQF